jgi:hypothetical protein
VPAQRSDAHLVAALLQYPVRPFIGDGNTIALFKAENILPGTFPAPHRDVNYPNPVVFNGPIIALGLSIHSMGDPEAGAD